MIKSLLLSSLAIVPAFSGALAVDAALSPGTLRCAVVACDADTELELARGYLVETARPGGTMARQGPELAIERLHPEFAKRLAIAIKQARDSGLPEAGIFSAYRPPAFGVGGFSDKYYSLHAYGLAVDMHGIGRAGSEEAQRWHRIAAENGIVCPYGYQNRVEWNHCQPTHLDAVRERNPLRDTITGSGPIDLGLMFHTGDAFLAAADSTRTSVIANRRQASPSQTESPPESRRSKQLQRTRVALSRRPAKSSRNTRAAAKSAAVRTRVASVSKRAK
jgi:hypothetical protein